MVRGLIEACSMILSFVLSWLRRPARFAWTPALDLSDHQVLAALIPHAHY